MNSPETHNATTEQLLTAEGQRGGTTASGEGFRLSAKVLIASAVVALAAGALAWGLADMFRESEAVIRDRKNTQGPAVGFAELMMSSSVANGVKAYAILGGILAVGLGVTAALLSGRLIALRIILAAGTGFLLGTFGAAASARVLIPMFFSQVQTADFTLTMLVHLGIWCVVGAASGTAFGVGSGSFRVLGQSVIGGITGAAVATLVYDFAGAFLPLAHTERPLSEIALTRLAASVFLSLSIAVGILLVASQKPRSVTKRA
jgi:hypothetical protein